MGWKFEVDRRLEAMNRRRQRQGRPPLILRDVALLTGIQYKSLLNLARNSTLRATNTRFIDALCAFFGCDPSQIMVRNPALQREPDDGEIDQMLARMLAGETPQAAFHVETLYGAEAEQQWRVDRDDHE